ncbi:hypothetical protein [Streptosporangium sp. NBC_01469]|uniref:hypothetical protein n=1 Tax=Streptosporangium sp. NBC_01469 TaxID=2903898 RepID=UPI002E2CA9E5|nr:hypothetical protein [Streptosporangium sp. NBC_01469]
MSEALAARPYLRRKVPLVRTVGDYSPVGVPADLYGEDDGGQVVETGHQIPVGLK